MDLSQLREFIVTDFDENELRDLCVDLHINYKSLPGEDKSAKARELVDYCRRDNDLRAKLEAASLRLKPGVSNTLVPQNQSSLSPAANQSGGVTINAQTVYIHGDVTGRDRITAGSTGADGSESTPPPLSDTQTTPPQPQDQFKGEPLPTTEIVTPSGQSVRGRLIKALRDPLWQGIGALIAILALVVAIASLPQAHVIAPPASTPMAIVAPTQTLAITPIPTWTPIPTAAVKAFAVMRGAERSTVGPKETISLTAGESIRIRAEVLTNVDRNEFLFTWFTCQRGDAKAVWGQGVIEMSYVAPSTTGSDCIRVKVEKGGALLDDKYVWVQVPE